MSCDWGVGGEASCDWGVGVEGVMGVSVRGTLEGGDAAAANSSGFDL